jgi:hypothetical protein
MGAGDKKRKPAGPVRARPTSPAGGGGPGHFRDADSFRADEKQDDTVRHAKAPAGRAKVSAPAASGTVKRRKAPITKPYAKQIASVSGPAITGGVRLQVLADKMNDAEVDSESAETSFDTSYELGGEAYNLVDGKIKSFTKKVVFRSSVTIQTAYAADADPNHTSKYGRGTTPADKASGNVTLGFHESCHRIELVAYVTNTPYPKFAGKVGMTEEEFLAAKEEFEDAVKAFNAGLDELGAAVDEVGSCTKSDWLAGTCK